MNFEEVVLKVPAIICFSNQGAKIAVQLKEALPESIIYFHDSVDSTFPGTRFTRVLDLITNIFDKNDGLVFIGPSGIAVRAIAPNLKSKFTDPPTIVVDVGGRYCISLLSGHEGGANNLAYTIGNIIGAEPVVTTTTEAEKNIIIGAGCRRGCSVELIVQAARSALSTVNLEIEQVRCLASVDIKADENGLIQAAHELGVPLRLVSSAEIKSSPKFFNQTQAALKYVDLPAVAEPAALLAGRRTSLILPKTIYDQVTIAIAKENCL